MINCPNCQTLMKHEKDTRIIECESMGDIKELPDDYAAEIYGCVSCDFKIIVPEHGGYRV